MNSDSEDLTALLQLLDSSSDCALPTTTTHVGRCSSPLSISDEDVDYLSSSTCSETSSPAQSPIFDPFPASREVKPFVLGPSSIQSAKDARAKRMRYLKERRQRRGAASASESQGSLPISKKEKRKQANRRSAERSRKRKADHVENLERQLKILRYENELLRGRLQVYEPNPVEVPDDAMIFRSFHVTAVPTIEEKSTRVNEKSASQHQVHKFVAIMMAVISVWLTRVMNAFALPIVSLAGIQLTAKNSVGSRGSTAEDKDKGVSPLGGHHVVDVDVLCSTAVPSFAANRTAVPAAA